MHKNDLHRKSRSRTDGLSRTETQENEKCLKLESSQDQDYSAAKKVRMRSSPRSNSVLEVAYDTRMCSPVPKPSPGTVATCASLSNLPATSDADFMPPRPRNAEMLG